MDGVRLRAQSIMTASVRRLRRPAHLILDFDATLTVRDTIVLLREIPIQRNKRLGYEAHRVPEWSSLEAAYMQDYERHRTAEESAEIGINDVIWSFVERAKAYSQKLARKRVVEELSMKRLKAWDVFRGVQRTDVCRAAETVLTDGRLRLRDYWSDMLRMFLQNDSQSNATQKSSVSIISLNWSETFIRECLLSALRLELAGDLELQRFVARELQIHACEITGLDEEEGSSGHMQADVLSSADKLKFLPFASQRNHAMDPYRPHDPEAPYLVYVGDSATDFDCLMLADAGVWLCPASDLKEASERCEQCFKPLKLRLRPISDTRSGELSEDELVWAQDFEQISDFLSKTAP